MRALAVKHTQFAQRVDGKSRELVIDLAALQLDDQPRNTWILTFGGRRQQTKPMELHRIDARLQVHQPLSRAPWRTRER